MPDCTLTTLSTAAKCFDCLSLTEKQALKVAFLAQALLGLGGSDFTNVNTLKKAVACFTCVSDFRIDSMALVIAQRKAMNAGKSAVVVQPINVLRQLIKCVPCGDPKTYRAQEMFLRCMINQFVGTGAN
jgi:hypothetical protein